MTLTGDAFVEVMAAGVAKERGARGARGRASVCAREHVVAFGDQLTDAGMLAWAGLGVAVANAHPSVLAAADEVTASNDDDGVAVVLERLMPSREQRVGRRVVVGEERARRSSRTSRSHRSRSRRVEVRRPRCPRFPDLVPDLREPLGDGRGPLGRDEDDVADVVRPAVRRPLVDRMQHDRREDRAVGLPQRPRDLRARSR